MTRRMESLNISRRELLKEFFALTPKQKKMMMKKISIFNLVMFIYKTTGSLVLKSSTKVKLHALFISTKETKLRRRVDFIDHYGEKRVAFLHFRCVDIASSSNDKKSFVHNLELLPRRHLNAQRAKQLEFVLMRIYSEVIQMREQERLREGETVFWTVPPNCPTSCFSSDTTLEMKTL